MELDQKLFDVFAQEAKTVSVDVVSVGLGYTAVGTSDGGLGLAYTMINEKTSCSVIKNYHNYEGKPALELLELIRSQDPIPRGMGLALINALNHKRAVSFASGTKDTAMLDILEVGPGTRVAMVGYFGPMVPLLNERGAQLEIVDWARDMGSTDHFYEKLGNWAEVLVLTATSLLNGTTEEILKAAHAGVQTLMLGPSTPMVPEAFDHLPVRLLAGTVPMERDKVLAAIRHGAGTPVIQRFSKKAYVAVGDGSPENG
jgi:hypothetical protein